MWGDTLGNLGYIYGYSLVFSFLLGGIIGYYMRGKNK